MTAPHEIPCPGPAAGLAARLAEALPAIETKRLRLRAPRLPDFSAYAEIATSPAGRFLIDEPNREEAWFDFTQMVATWVLRGHGLWSVERREDSGDDGEGGDAEPAGGELVGFVLIGFEPGDHEPELGYMLRPGAEGRGYAAEAAEAARDWAFAEAGLSTLVSTIDRDNARSRRLAERLGGRRDAAAEAAHDDAILVYRYEKEAA